ncbi:MAG: ethanolamine utilization protein EutH [Ruminococcaceae bacterium]|nr:ethanolamine utilization protein EutH [Oscillospiraceae bacterium]
MKIEYIFAFFAAIAVLDKITGNHFKLGDEFEKGIMTIGDLLISMAGMIILSPLLAKGMSFVFAPVVELFGMDISAPAAFFANDCGGAAMAYELSDNELLRAYNGHVLASMFGATLCPVIPIALKIVDKKYHEDVLTGLLCGLATIPFGCFTSGIIMGVAVKDMLLNTLPIIILSVFICLGLAKAPELIRKILGFVGSILFTVMTIGLGIGIVEKLCGITVIPGLAPIDESFIIVGNIAIILAGVFPLLSILSKLLDRPFKRFGKLLGINDTSVLGFITTLANSIPMFSMMKKMDKKGRIMNMAFAVSAGFALGDHLAFTLSYDSKYAVPLMIGKLVGGVFAMILAGVIYKGMSKRIADNV